MFFPQTLKEKWSRIGGPGPLLGLSESTDFTARTCNI